MRYFVGTAIPVEDGTLLREERPGAVPEVLNRRRLVWEATPSLVYATSSTADWDPITQEEAERIEAYQRVKSRERHVEHLMLLGESREDAERQADIIEWQSRGLSEDEIDRLLAGDLLPE